MRLGQCPPKVLSQYILWALLIHCRTVVEGVGADLNKATTCEKELAEHCKAILQLVKED